MGGDDLRTESPTVIANYQKGVLHSSYFILLGIYTVGIIQYSYSTLFVVYSIGILHALYYTLLDKMEYESWYSTVLSILDSWPRQHMRVGIL